VLQSVSHTPAQRAMLPPVQVKLLEGGTQAGGISAFLGKAVEPPADAVVRHAVSSLQLIGALTCVCRAHQRLL
jgi:hypothetical protein